MISRNFPKGWRKITNRSCTGKEGEAFRFPGHNTRPLRHDRLICTAYTNISVADTYEKSVRNQRKYRKNIIIFVDFSKKMRIMCICMDIENCIKDGFGNLPELIQNRKVLVGAKQIRKAINSRAVSLVLLAKNADFVLTESLEALCLQNHIPFVWVPNMVQLGHACGIDVGAAAAAVVE